MMDRYRSSMTFDEQHRDEDDEKSRSKDVQRQRFRDFNVQTEASFQREGASNVNLRSWCMHQGAAKSFRECHEGRRREEGDRATNPARKRESRGGAVVLQEPGS